MSPQQVFSISLCGVFYFPWHRHQIERTNGFYSLLRKTQTKWGKRSCPSFEAAEVVLNPRSLRPKIPTLYDRWFLNTGPLDRKSDALSLDHGAPIMEYSFAKYCTNNHRHMNYSYDKVVTCFRVLLKQHWRRHLPVEHMPPG